MELRGPHLACERDCDRGHDCGHQLSHENDRERDLSTFSEVVTFQKRVFQGVFSLKACVLFLRLYSRYFY